MKNAIVPWGSIKIIIPSVWQPDCPRTCGAVLLQSVSRVCVGEEQHQACGFWNFSTPNSHWQSDPCVTPEWPSLPKPPRASSPMHPRVQKLFLVIFNLGFFGIFLEFFHFPQEWILTLNCVLNERRQPPHMLMELCVCQGRLANAHKTAMEVVVRYCVQQMQKRKKTFLQCFYLMQLRIAWELF